MAKLSAHGTVVAKVEIRTPAPKNDFGWIADDIQQALCSDGMKLEKRRSYYTDDPSPREWSPWKLHGKVKAEYRDKAAWLAYKLSVGWMEVNGASALNPVKDREARSWYYPGELTPEYRTALTVCFPNWRGKKVYVKVGPVTNKRLDSYWDGGSRDYFAFYNTITREALPVHSNHPFFEASQPNTLRELPSHVFMLEHSIFCGKDGGITIYATTTPEQNPPTLQAPATLALTA